MTLHRSRRRQNTCRKLWSHQPKWPSPVWRTNHLLASSPFKTLKAMRTMIEGGAYKDEQVAFINEIAKNK
jgi:hypothetical protein